MKKLMLIDPHIKDEPMWIDFYDRDFDMTNGDQYVCEIKLNQIIDILNSSTLKIEIPEIVKIKLNIKTKPYYIKNIRYNDIYYVDNEKVK